MRTAIPGQYALLADQTYKELYGCLYGHCESAERHMIDFEAAALKAIQEVSANTTVSGCYYHLKKSWHRQLQSKGLTNTGQNDMKLFC